MLKFAGLVLTSNGTSLRGGLHPIVLRKDLVVRKPFRRIFFKKNGTPRSDYSVWLSALEVERKAANFDPSEGEIRFFPDCGDPKRLNLALLSSTETSLSTACAAKILRDALIYAERNFCSLRVFSRQDDFSKIWIFSQVKMNCSTPVTLEVVALPGFDIVHAELGKKDQFIDRQEAVWLMLTGGFRVEQQCIEVSADSEATMRPHNK